MNSIVEVKDLKKHFVSRQGPAWKRSERVVKAVDGISFSVGERQTMGLVGESGCGKTTTGMMLVGLEPSTSGSVSIRGEEITSIDEVKFKTIRKKMQMVFQDPYASLDPMWNLSQIICEPFVIHDLYSAAERQERVAHLLTQVGLDGSYSTRYPHELSGGQRQRVAIARALALDPEFIVADEPTSALDVSVKAQIINLLEELQEKNGLSMIFISHDLSVVYHICDYIQVMYYGKIVESGPTELLFSNPVHPYTRVLLESIPIADPKKRRSELLGYQEHKRISESILDSNYSIDPVEEGEEPLLHEIEPEHFVRCHRR